MKNNPIDPKVIERFEKAVKPTEAMIAMINSLRESMQKQQITIDNLTAPTREIIQRFDEMNKQLDFAAIRNSWMANQEQIKRVFKPLIDAQNTLRNLPEHIQSSIMVLAQNGWYLDMSETPRFLHKIANEINNDNLENVDELLCEYYTNRIEEIEIKVKNKLPKRASIFESVFKAHREEVFELTVPVFLIQIDGICKELANGYFFMRKYGQPQTAKYVKSIEDEYIHLTIQSAFLTPLKNVHSINYNLNERDDDFDKLNRHLVIHGDCVDYNTKVNSFKSISLLNYIVEMLTNNE